MDTRMISKLVRGLRAFHDDEQGSDVIGSVAVGAVGVLLATLIFSTMSSVIKTEGKNMFSSIFKGIGSTAIDYVTGGGGWFGF